MSRSTKLPYHKDKRSSTYWRTIRRVSKTLLNSGEDIPNPKSIINDYNYREYSCYWNVPKNKRK